MLVRHKDAFPHIWKISLNTSPFGACNQRGEQAKLSPSGTISTKAQLNNRNDCRRPYFKLSNNYKPAFYLNGSVSISTDIKEHKQLENF